MPGDLCRSIDPPGVGSVCPADEADRAPGTGPAKRRLRTGSANGLDHADGTGAKRITVIGNWDHPVMLASRVCSDCSVRDRALCGTLSDDELVALNRIGQRRHIRAGQTLIWAGDDGVICANVLQGIMKLTASTRDGREQTVGLLYPADFVGRADAGQASFTITAVTDVELCIFPRKDFEHVLHDHVRMERLLFQRTMAALDDARTRMLTLSRRSAGERIAGFLIDMADRVDNSGCRAGSDGPLTFDLPLSRGQIAELLGLTIETVSRQLAKFKAAGIIALPGPRAITIRDRAALAARLESGE